MVKLNGNLNGPKQEGVDYKTSYAAWIELTGEEDLKEEFFDSCPEDWNDDQDMIELEENGRFDEWCEEQYHKEMKRDTFSTGGFHGILKSEVKDEL